MDTKAAVSVKDNLLLEQVEILLNGEPVEYTRSGEDFTFSIPAANAKQSVRITASDAAGNRAELEVSDFLVSASALVRWVNNTPLFLATLAGAGGLYSSCCGRCGCMSLCGIGRLQYEKQSQSCEFDWISPALWRGNFLPGIKILERMGLMVDFSTKVVYNRQKE